MAAELQSLLDRIQTEGIAKADAEAKRILEEARAKAGAIVAEAEEQRLSFRAQAEAEARQFQQRAEQAVRQAARDVVLGVTSSIEQALHRVLFAKVSEALTPDFLATLIADVIRTYAQSPDAGGGLQLVLKPEQTEKLAAVVLQGVQDDAKQNVQIRSDNGITAGFRVLLANGRIEHDFSATAVQSAMSHLLRPELSKLLAND